MTLKPGKSSWQLPGPADFSLPDKIVWGLEAKESFVISAMHSAGPSFNPLNLRMILEATISDRSMLHQGMGTAEEIAREAFGTDIESLHVTMLQAHYEPLANFYKLRGDMDRLGIITPEGITAFENGGEVQGSLAVKVHINDDKVQLDLHIVDEAGTVLARWEGVEVIDDTQVTWCFSDTGNIKISMEPILEPA